MKFNRMACTSIVCVPIIYFLSVSECDGHSVWTRRNETGPWTVALYHCDEEVANSSFELINAGENTGLNLVCEPEELAALGSVNSKAWYLDRAINGVERCRLISIESAKHPSADMSIEMWMKVTDIGADIEIGFLNGISMRIRFSNQGDRFHLLGRNSEDVDDIQYSAPGFSSFPRFDVWNHFGVCIHGVNVEQTPDGHYRYGEGSIARFYFNSHAVGFVHQRILSIAGLEFERESKVCVLIHHGELIFDEIQISSVDWTDPLGHGGESHGTILIEHAFENGRIPEASVGAWDIY